MKYIFPDAIGNAMSKVTMRTQLEASMLSMFFIMVGVVLSAIYVFIYTSFALWFKIVTGINAFFGLVFLGSFLATSYQQWQTVLEVEQFQKEQHSNTLKGGEENATK